MNYNTLNLRFISKNRVHNFLSKDTFFSLISLLFMFALLSSSLAATFNGFSPFVSGAEHIQVGTEPALRSAINAANGPTVIALTTDITLTGSALSIPANKDITLVSVGNGTDFLKLIGANNHNTIEVKGKLTLESLTITHPSGTTGMGVYIFDGDFAMTGGAVTNNNGAEYGGGGVIVSSDGSFNMMGGTIANNTAMMIGGGVFVDYGSFSMNSGTITNNTVRYGEGGVYSSGSFSMNSGTITNNTATVAGGGAYIRMDSGSFSMKASS